MISFIQKLLGSPTLSEEQIELAKAKQDLELHYDLMLLCNIYAINQTVKQAERIKAILISQDLKKYSVNGLHFTIKNDKLTFRNSLNFN